MALRLVSRLAASALSHPAAVLPALAVTSLAASLACSTPISAKPRRDTEAAAEQAAAKAERAAAKAAAEKAAQSMHPLTIVVSTRHQHVKVYNSSGRVISEAPVSTGQPGHETPHGVFSIIAKEQMHHSNLYNDAPMPWMERITWSGVALHAGNLPGYPASHGCIRLPHAYSRSLYSLTRLGTRVIVSGDDPAPTHFAHEDLFQPLPTAAEVAAIAAATAGATMTPADAPRPMQTAQLDGPAPLAAGQHSAALTLIGITPANASEAARSGPRTREQAAAERAARITDAKARVDGAQQRRADAEAEARNAAGALTQAQEALKDLRQNEARLRQDIDKAQRQSTQTLKEIAALARLAQRLDEDKDEEMGKALEAEQRLEDRLAQLEQEVEAGRKAVAAESGRITDAERTLAAAQGRKAASADALKQVTVALDEARDALAAQMRAEANRDKPIAVLVSRKTGKLYVRQGFEPLFETTVGIEAPDLPIGTHVFTAVAEAEAGGELRWSLLTVQNGATAAEQAARRKSRRAKDAGNDDPPDSQTVAQASTAMSALDRISVPADARERIAEFIKPGSSLIVSDHGPGHETGRGTEFVILTR